MYASNSGAQIASGKSRNAQVTATTSQGSLGTTTKPYKSTTKMNYAAMSPKGIGGGLR